MATDALARQLSSSWTYPIDAETEQIFQQFAAQGQSFFNASGDNDAGVGEIATPCDDPNITSVGGTTLTTSGPSGVPGYQKRSGIGTWRTGRLTTGRGTGGGISATYRIPSWQLNVSMAANKGSTSFRNIPMWRADGRQCNCRRATTARRRMSAARVARRRYGLASSLWPTSKPLAKGRPTLWVSLIRPYTRSGLAQTTTNCFHDITTGNNSWSDSPNLFYAVPGYDLCSGWGTPIGSNLVNLLAPWIRCKFLAS